MSTIESFCNSVLGTSYAKVLQKISKDDYKQFKLPKKNGTRTINYLEKDSELWKLQHHLLGNYLIKQDLPVCVKGFKKGENYIAFLSEHVGSQFFLRLDIASFFPSISDSCIKNELSNLLIYDSDNEKVKLLDLICNIVTLEGKLPQGACTSPMVSNLVMARIDQRITKYCQVFNIRYTRYADDLLFSSNTFDFSQKKWFIKKIKHILSSQKLKLNYSKIKFGVKELVLNGYVISNREVRLSRNRLSDIRLIVKFAKKNHDLINRSPKEFIFAANKLPLKYRNLNAYPFRTVFQFIQYMCGYRAFLISMINNYSLTSFQKELRRLIFKIEVQIKALSLYY